MAISILQMTAPVLITFLLGFFMKQKKLLSSEGLQGLKNLVSYITLPVVMFNAFLTATYSKTIFISCVTVFMLCALALLLGFFLRRFVKPYGKYLPFLVTSFEGGMLGYALYSLLYPDLPGQFAMVDIGQSLCAFTVFLTTLKGVNGEHTSLSSMFKNMIKNQMFIAITLGVTLGLLGVGDIVKTTPLGSVLLEIMRFLTAPTSAVILIVVGYELQFSKKLLKPVLITVALRLVVMALLLIISYFVIFAFVPYDTSLFVAFMLGFSLPASFIIPLFMQDKEKLGHEEYVSTTLSLQTLCTILLFIAISWFTLAA